MKHFPCVQSPPVVPEVVPEVDLPPADRSASGGRRTWDACSPAQAGCFDTYIISIVGRINDPPCIFLIAVIHRWVIDHPYKLFE